MAKKSMNKLISWILIGLGLIAVVGSHVMILITPLDTALGVPHATFNLVAAGLILVGSIILSMKE